MPTSTSPDRTPYRREDQDMAEPTLYERLGGIFASWR